MCIWFIFTNYHSFTLNGQVGALIEEPKFSHVSRNLFITLAANGRIGESAKIISAFNGTSSAVSPTFLIHAIFLPQFFFGIQIMYIKYFTLQKYWLQQHASLL